MDKDAVILNDLRQGCKSLKNRVQDLENHIISKTGKNGIIKASVSEELMMSLMSLDNAIDRYNKSKGVE